MQTRRMLVFADHRRMMVGVSVGFTGRFGWLRSVFVVQVAPVFVIVHKRRITRGGGHAFRVRQLPRNHSICKDGLQEAVVKRHF